MKRPSALFDEEGRRRLAHMLVWGSESKSRVMGLLLIERRIYLALERIAGKVAPQLQPQEMPIGTGTQSSTAASHAD